MKLRVFPVSLQKWQMGKNSSDEQPLSMTSCIIAILRQTLKLAVSPASFSKLENGKKTSNEHYLTMNRNQVFP